MRTSIFGIYMKGVKKGDKVHILCEAKLEDGTVCYKNDEEKPLEFVVGEGKFFSAIENEMKGMKEGESKTMTLEPKEAFGQYKDDLVVEVSKNDFRSDAKMDLGLRVEVNTPSGKTLHGTIMEIKDETLTLDFNHPLAGKKILFTVTVISVVEK